MLWDIFCRVIDNHGDLGVCWRLSADLATRGHQIRLWVDDASALSWMAPEASLNAEGWGQLASETGHIEVRPWSSPLNDKSHASQIWIEAFGCDLPDHFVNWASTRLKDLHETTAPVWLNLEYLSAESYVERSHKLPSPVMSGPLKGRTKWFFYPGFNDKTGGLLRESHVDQSLLKPAPSAPLVPQKTFLFCYEPGALHEAIDQLLKQSPANVWHVAHGRGALAFENALTQLPPHKRPKFHILPPMSQASFDVQLAQSDLNFVRGEDSLVRAIWAGQAFIWHIYPQMDGAHGPKLQAFLDWLEAPESLRSYHLRWNDLTQGPLPPIDLPLWQACVVSARKRLMAQMDLTSQILQFVAEKR
ncbi:MAG: elongation factor P maturation arginine rhamnosyltransferase EarP [Rhodoferax sp.]